MAGQIVADDDQLQIGQLAFFLELSAQGGKRFDIRTRFL